MNVPKFSLPLALAGLWLAAFAAELTLLQRQWARSDGARLRLEAKREELDRFWRQSPSPTAANEQAVRVALTAAEDGLASCRQEAHWLQTESPSDPVAAFFSLARFAEQMRRHAVDAGVDVPASGRFGFESYAQEGPSVDDLPRVARQQVVLSRVLPVLLAAGPSSLLAVRREGQKGSQRVPGSGAPGEYFVLPPARSIRQEGLVEADAFQVEFAGQTPVLRQFLNGLAELPEAVVVRAVEAELRPMPGNQPPRSRQDPTPLLRPQYTKFTVTLECPRLVVAPAAAP